MSQGNLYLRVLYPRPLEHVSVGPDGTFFEESSGSSRNWAAGNVAVAVTGKGGVSAVGIVDDGVGGTGSARRPFQLLVVGTETK